MQVSTIFTAAKYQLNSKIKKSAMYETVLLTNEMVLAVCSTARNWPLNDVSSSNDKRKQNKNVIKRKSIDLR